MKNNTAPVQGVRVLRAAIRDYISRIFFSFLNRLFPSLRNYALPTPAPVELFVTERKLVFTNPLMARAILQHRRPAMCSTGGEKEPLWDPFGYGHSFSLN